MTAKEYLSKIQTYRRTVQTYADRIEELYHDASGLRAIVYDKDRVQVSPEDRMEKVFIKIEAEAEKYARARIRYERELHKRIDMIGTLDNPQYIKLLTLRYVDGLRWEEIACTMSYSFRHVTRLHGQALAAFTARHKDVLECPKR